MSNAIAIDFGTIRTKLAYYDTVKRQVRLMMLGEDERLYIPSLFYIHHDGTKLCGEQVLQMLEDDPAGVIDTLKRRLRETIIRANKQKATPLELLTMFFEALRERTKEIPQFQEQTPDEVRLTIPALFGPPDKAVIEKAAVNAGFTTVSFVDEPVSAARAWMTEIGGDDSVIVVVDCGGGTVDWACLRRTGNEYDIVPECPPSGDRNIGGYDLDQEMLNYFKEKAQNNANVLSELEENAPKYIARVRVIKEKFSKTGVLTPLRVKDQALEANAEDLTQIIVDRFVSQVCQCLSDFLTNLKTNAKIDKPTILLVGGSAKTVGLAKAVENITQCKVVWWERSEYATVLGAIDPAVAESGPEQNNLVGRRNGAKTASPNNQKNVDDTARLSNEERVLQPPPKDTVGVERDVIRTAQENVGLCTNCGSPAGRGVKFCASCGNRIGSAANLYSQMPSVGNQVSPVMVSQPFEQPKGVLFAGHARHADDAVKFVASILIREGLEIQSLQNDEKVIIQGRESGAWYKTAMKAVVGLQTAVTVTLTKKDENLIVHVGAGKWLDKTAVAGIGLFLFWPALITAGIGIYKQQKLFSRIEAEVAVFISGKTE